MFTHGNISVGNGLSCHKACFFYSQHNFQIFITNITLRHHLKGWKKKKISGRNVLTWQCTIKWENVWSFITSSGLESRGSLRLGIPFTAFISGWGQRGGVGGGHCCLSADLCRLDFPPSLARLFFRSLFSNCGNGCSFFLSFFFKGILSFLSRSSLYLRPDAPKAGTKDKCYTIPGRGMERWWGWGRGCRSVRKKRKNGHALFCEPGGRPGADG